MTPARMLTTIVRVATTVPPAGNSTPSALKSALRPFARPSPSTSPRMDAINPTTNASSITTLRTCRLEPPIVRSVANSRTRCAMVIESVLAMTKLPTNRAMNPKPSRNFCTTPVDLLMSLISEDFLACEVSTLAVGGSSGLIADASRSGATPLLAATWISSSLPSLWNSC